MVCGLCVSARRKQTKRLWDLLHPPPGGGPPATRTFLNTASFKKGIYLYFFPSWPSPQVSIFFFALVQQINGIFGPRSSVLGTITLNNRSDCSHFSSPVGGLLDVIQGMP